MLQQIAPQVSIRPATIDDAGASAAILCRTWQSAFMNILSPEELARGTDINARVAMFRLILSSGGGYYIAYYDNAPCGILSFGKSRDTDKSDAAEIISVYTLENYWGKGVGTAMIEFALTELDHRGYRQVLLWVFEKNERARRFYEKMGFTPEGARKEGRFGNVTEIRYVKVFPVSGK
jgi:GNAT superfamily N-acetyltransferase